MGDRHISQPPSAADALLRLGRLSPRELSMESLLQTVADLVTTVLPGDIEASVTLLIKDAPSTMASTGQLAVDLDERQYERGHGPCLHAARISEVTEIINTRTESRWVDYVARAAERGNLSSLSIPLVIDEEEGLSGALNLYAQTPDGFDEDSRSVAVAFGPYAAVAAGNVYAYQSARKLADGQQAALASRAVIEQAKGVLIERYKVTPDHAFRLLVLASMNANRKLRDVAEDLVHTGELPVVTPRGTGRHPRGSQPRSRPGTAAPEHS
ncbi:GAF and ANTAR domain-containing protein [Modestobacter altitudinis]|uniref:GAF and ANTAR domain-containing protein n=1 Tax=Modestobacter altitudinis TaxID=2213158 RepID=UPI001FE67225|nr:GAF and ANTAR domain-containing protein [Modestobacter altitudinis]